eukprot:GHUV01022324.1.p1 GENE.GHUV01022324.1~~GHUV01022324.1.p1  ORF type:complete len:161 (-),score=27.33 GHUV01022324.1:1510-1992(-)
MGHDRSGRGSTGGEGSSILCPLVFMPGCHKVSETVRDGNAPAVSSKIACWFEWNLCARRVMMIMSRYDIDRLETRWNTLYSHEPIAMHAVWSLCIIVCRHRTKIPDALKELVCRCWDADYDKRPEMTDVIEQLQDILQKMPPEPSVAGGAAGGGGCCSVQ